MSLFKKFCWVLGKVRKKAQDAKKLYALALDALV